MDVADPQPSTPFVRPYESSDIEQLIHIFRETAGASIRNAGDPALHIGSYIWARPYVKLSPETCFVLDDGHGTAVGYIIGTSDTKAYVQQYESTYAPTLSSVIPHPSAPSCRCYDHTPSALVDSLRATLYSPSSMLHANVPSLLESYPAHLHVDILPAFQKQGFGRKMMDTFCAKLVDRGAAGVHLVMDGTNQDAGEFYARVGFRRFPEVVDGGVSGEEGRDESQSIWFVRSF